MIVMSQIRLAWSYQLSEQYKSTPQIVYTYTYETVVYFDI